MAALLLAGAAAIGMAHAEVPVSTTEVDAAVPPTTTPADAGPAASDPAPAAMVGNARLVTTLTSKAGPPSLVGKSGEVYEPGPDLHWRRGSAGGVSTDVLALYRSGDSGLFAVGSRAPLFRRKAGVWSAFHLGNRGRAAVSPGSAQVISIGRHIYELTGKSWLRIASAKGRVRAIYAASKNRIYVATTRDQLFVGRNGWRKIAMKLASGDQVRSIVGVPGKQTLILTVQNRLYLLGKKGAKLLSMGPSLRGFDVHLIAKVDGKLLLAGRSSKSSGAKPLLLELAKDKLKAVGPLWSLEPGDRFALVHQDPQGRLLVASHRGQLRIRSKDGRWSNGEVDLAPPAPPESFTKSGPALSK